MRENFITQEDSAEDEGAVEYGDFSDRPTSIKAAPRKFYYEATP